VPTFDGKRLVLGPTEAKSPFWVDKGNRNERMIKELVKDGVNGMFLFYFYKNNESTGEGFMMPPGLSDDETHRFQQEFLVIFEKYAKLANKGR